MNNHEKPNLHPTGEAIMAAREQAVEKAVDAYGLVLFNYARRLIRDHHLAEDMLQSLWLSVLERFPLEGIMQIGMLKRRLRQIVIDRIRLKVPQIEEPFECGANDVPDRRVYEPLSATEESCLKELFWRNFQDVQLHGYEKDAFLLKARYGYTIKEVAEHLKAPTSTVSDWIQKVRRVCADSLNHNPYDGETIHKVHRKGRRRTGARHRKTTAR